jgi:hypothetical protein
VRVPRVDERLRVRRLPEEERERGQDVDAPPEARQQRRPEEREDEEAGEVGEFSRRPVVEQRLEGEVVQQQQEQTGEEAGRRQGVKPSPVRLVCEIKPH